MQYCQGTAQTWNRFSVEIIKISGIKKKKIQKNLFFINKQTKNYNFTIITVKKISKIYNFYTETLFFFSIFLILSFIVN
jgi:hypothetical protein